MIKDGEGENKEMGAATSHHRTSFGAVWLLGYGNCADRFPEIIGGKWSIGHWNWKDDHRPFGVIYDG